MREVAEQVGKVKVDTHKYFEKDRKRLVYVIEDTILEFAGFRQRNAQGMTVLDTSNYNINIGTDFGGVLGASALATLATTIDYRNGLIKFEYTQK
jgi:hypothetical protein